MDLNSGIVLLLGCQLVLLQLCESQTNDCSYDGDVRLVNGTGPHEGRVEICRSGEWNTLCDHWWDDLHLEARVICAQLHYPPEDSLLLYGAPFGQGNGSTIYIHCDGSESRVADCYRYHPYCDHAYDTVGVRCLSCNTHGDVRLRGSSSQLRGRVEICVNNVWGTVCDDYWDSIDASVVCNQLGYSRYGSWGYSGAPFGPGRGPIHLGDVRCTGSEQNLTDCSYTNYTLGSDCTHREDAAVYCQPTLQCEEGDLRLAEGSINHGVVEICVNETWGTICSNNWAQSEATVICRQLGFSGLGWLHYYGPGSGSLHYSNILCTGRELWLIDCEHDGFIGSCYSAHVYCNFYYFPPPMRFQVTCEESNLCTLSWQQPPINSRRHGNISYYFVSCTIMGTRSDDQSITYNVYYSTYISISLLPYRFYNCCVAAVNGAGRGNSSCQTIITHEAAPTAAPINIEAYQLNFTSVFLSWRPPLAQYQNGIIQGYYIYFELSSTDEAELSGVNSTETKFEYYTTQNQYFLMDNLQPFAVYTSRVAAYTVERGPFSEPLTVVLSGAPTAAPINIEAHQLNSTSVFLSWRLPLAQYWNGIILGYYIHVELNSTNEAELSEVNSTETKFEYTTQDQHLLMDDLQPFAVYTCRVAAYTIERGPFSEPLTVVLSDEEENQFTQSQGNATATVAAISTLLIVVVIIVGICLAVQIGYKLAKSKKRRRRPVQNDYVHRVALAVKPKPSRSVTNTLKESNRAASAVKPKPSRSVTNTLKEGNSHNTCTARRNERQHYCDGSHTLRIPPQVPPRTHSLPRSLNRIDDLENVQLQDLSNQVLRDWNPRVDTRVDSENAYQPLILSWCSKNTTASEYQSLTQFKQC